MTDNEIIKALECCISNKPCQECAFLGAGIGAKTTCEVQMMKQALDLINRKQAEIEALKTHEEREHQLCKNVCAPKYEEEIERLHKEVGSWEVETKEARTDIDQAVDEAIKEFAEQAKHRLCLSGDYLEEFDNLVQEMVGDEV